MNKKFLAAVFGVTLVNAAHTPAAIVINEIESDTFNTPSTDYGEFIELYSTTGTATSLAGLTLVLINGNGDVSYGAIDLDPFTTDANGYFVFGTTSITQAGDTSFLGSGNFLQNGQDAVALYSGDATSFPNGTAATTVGLVDVIVYGTNDADDTGLLTALGQSVQYNEGPNPSSDAVNISLSRVPNGTGAFEQASPTPGTANVPEPAMLGMTVMAGGLLLARRRSRCR